MGERRRPVPRKCFFERLHVRPTDERRIRENLGDCGVNVWLDRVVLRFQVDQREWRRRRQRMHAMPDYS